jgi:hypothetical protein
MAPALVGLLKASPMIMQGLSALFSRGSGGGSQTPMNGQMEQLLRIQNQRMTQADPLYQAILKMAMGLMPKGVQRPMAPTSGAVPRPGGAIPRGQVY